MEEKKKAYTSDLFDIIETCLVSLVVIFIFITMVFRICVVDGESMENTLYNGERLLVTSAFGDPDRGDIVVFQESTSYHKPLVKRVIASGGEWVRLENGDGKLLITVYDKNEQNPVDLTDEYGTYKDYFRSLGSFGYASPLYFQVPEGTVFVLGDNRNNSSDSRYFGCVDVRTVFGSLVARVYPFSKFGKVG